MRKFLVKNKRIVFNILYPIAAFLLIVALWSLLSLLSKNKLLMPSATTIFSNFFDLIILPSFWKAVGGTLLRSLIAFLISFAAAAVLALVSTFSKHFRGVLKPAVAALRAAPTMAVILLSTLWLDYSESPILIGFLISFPLMYSAFYSALSSVDGKLLEMANVFLVPRRDKIMLIYVPSVLPPVFDSVQSVVSLTVKVVIAAEVIAQTKASIGIEMLKSNIVFDIGYLIAWTVAAVVLSYLLEIVVAIVKKSVGLKYGGYKF